jgi:hypothetical protein
MRQLPPKLPENLAPLLLADTDLYEYATSNLLKMERGGMQEFACILSDAELNKKSESNRSLTQSEVLDLTVKWIDCPKELKEAAVSFAESLGKVFPEEAKIASDITLPEKLAGAFHAILLDPEIDAKRDELGDTVMTERLKNAAETISQMSAESVQSLREDVEKQTFGFDVFLKCVEGHASGMAQKEQEKALNTGKREIQ